MANSSFYLPKNTQKVASRQPVEVFSYLEHTGNLPDITKYVRAIPQEGSYPVAVQTFEAEYAELKAIGVYIKSNFHPSGQVRSGKLRLYLYESASPHVLQDFVEVYVENVNNLSETLFEFRSELTLTIGTTYFWYITQVDGYDDNQPLYIGENGYPLVATGAAYNWTGAVATALSTLSPPTNFSFEAYKSITTLAVEVVGPKGKSLSDVYDALTTGDYNNLIPGWGVADMLKPYSPTSTLPGHYQLYIDNTSPTPSATGDGGNISGNWSSSSDLTVALADRFDNIVLTTTERVRVDWGLDYDTTPVEPVLNQIDFTAAEPGAPSVGDRYIHSGATGTMSGTSQACTQYYIYEWNGTDWTETAVSAGYTATDQTAAALYVFTTSWVVFIGSAYDTLDCSANYRLLAEGDALAINELVQYMHFRLHASGDTPPEISITEWKTIPPNDEESS